MNEANHTADDYLSEIRELKQRIKELEDELAAMKQGMGGYIDWAERTLIRRDVYERLKTKLAETTIS